MLLHDEVVRRRAPLVTAGYGNLKPDWPNATSVTLPAAVQPQGGDEDVVDQDRTVTRWRLFLHADADLLPTDRIEWDDGAGVKTYEVDGDVEAWKRRGRAHHLEAALIRVAQL